MSADLNQLALGGVASLVLGGLLAAYDLSKDRLFLEKATDLGARLLPAFNTGSGIPRASVDLQSAVHPSPETVLLSSHFSPAATSRSPLPHFSCERQSALHPSPSALLPSSHTSPRPTSL